MPCGCLMRIALPLPARSWKRFLLCQMMRDLMSPMGISPVWSGVPSSTTRQRTARYIDVRTEIFRRRGLSPIPVTCWFIGASVALTLLAHLPALTPVISKLYFSASLGKAFPEIRAGEVWRLVTPIFLHGRLLHLLFNMLWLYQLGGQIETQESSRSVAVMVLIFAIITSMRTSSRYRARTATFARTPSPSDSSARRRRSVRMC